MNKPVSEDAANFLLDDFQRKVDSAIREYERRTTTIEVRYRRYPLRKGGGSIFPGGRRPRDVRVKKKSARKMENRIGKVLQQPEVRESLNLALQKVTDDVFEISKVVTPVLLTLIATGKLDIEPIPLMFAGIALAIARVGVSAFCSKRPAKKRSASSRKSTKGSKQ